MPTRTGLVGLARLLGLVQLVGLGRFGGGAELLKNAGKHGGHMGRKRHLGYRFSGHHHHGAGINQGRSFLGAQADEVLVFEVGNAQGFYAFLAMYRLIPGSASPVALVSRCFLGLAAAAARPLAGLFRPCAHAAARLGAGSPGQAAVHGDHAPSAAAPGPIRWRPLPRP